MKNTALRSVSILQRLISSSEMHQLSCSTILIQVHEDAVLLIEDALLF